MFVHGVTVVLALFVLNIIISEMWIVTGSRLSFFHTFAVPFLYLHVIVQSMVFEWAQLD